MSEKKSKQRIATVKRYIVRVDLVCSGTLLERTKVCGKPNCRCATDPAARHGPYYEWNRREKNKLKHTIISPDEARRIRRAMDNYQTVLTLLEEWERHSIQIILSGRPGGHPGS